jgi:hypothetical protein
MSRKQYATLLKADTRGGNRFGVKGKDKPKVRRLKRHKIKQEINQ